MSLDWRTRPIQDWPGPLTAKRKPSPFRSGWNQTLRLLESEIRKLGGKEMIFQMALREEDIRLDGKIRANARPAEHPGIIVSFESRYGQLSYPCDTYDHWQDNVRAVALSLEKLRAVDRYGVTKRGEQYRGFGKLPPAGGTTVTMSASEAAAVVADAAGWNSAPPTMLTNADVARTAYRDAARRVHPDVPGGSVRAFQLLQEAKSALDAHHGGQA